MSNKVSVSRASGLLGSLGVWLLCAWTTVQQPQPAPKALRKSVSQAATARPSKPVSGAAPLSTTVTPAAAAQVDAETGLALDETMPIVKGQCTACHSSKLILQSHFDRDKWIERIRWMQRTQKLWDLGDTEKPILDYLTKYYGPIERPFDGRRLPLDPPKWHSR